MTEKEFAEHVRLEAVQIAQIFGDISRIVGLNSPASHIIEKGIIAAINLSMDAASQSEITVMGP